MYQQGDKIVYPQYGAGIISALELKEVDGAMQTYYVLNIPVGNLIIRISAAKAEHLRVRLIHEQCDIVDIMRSVLDCTISMDDNWNQRYKDNMERIKTGELKAVSGVFYGLLLREKERGLSTAEKKVMTTAKQIILSELILSLDIEKSDAEAILDTTFR